MVTHFHTTITDPCSLLSLEKAKKQLRIDAEFTDEDNLIQSYIDAAQEASENYINRGISERNFVMELSAFVTPLTFERNYENDVITKIEYYAPGAETLSVLDSSKYKLRKSNIVECLDILFVPDLSQMPAIAERDDAVIVTIKQGFTLATCPKTILQAINLRLSEFYEIREDRPQGFNSASNNLLRSYRKF
jgi:hypothetical protein